MVETVYRNGIRAVSATDGGFATFMAEIVASAAARRPGYALIYFSPDFCRGAKLVEALADALPDLHFAGCSTAGELTPQGASDLGALAVLLPADRFEVMTTIIPDLSTSGLAEVAELVGEAKRTMQVGTSRDLFALSLIDGLSFAAESLVSAVRWGLMDTPLVGGSAGDDLHMKRTEVITNHYCGVDCAIVLLVATDLPFHVFKTDNFMATDDRLVVTRSDPDRRLAHEFNAASAAEEYAAAIGLLPQELDAHAFASYPLVVKVGGEFFCRSIQRVNKDGSLTFFCAVDDGIVLSIGRSVNMLESTRGAFAEAGAKVSGVDVILGFDCILRRLDAESRQMTRQMSELYQEFSVIGFNTYGEQYRSLHVNQTFTGIAFGHAPAG